jgi:FKBP-type peptidyl-prolyl cis-trans isomerase SlyD
MNISKDKVVSVNYNLSVSKDKQPEELVEQTSKEHPFVFLYGHEAALPEFEGKLEGKKPGDPFDFSIECENGYGSREEENVIRIDRGAFEIDGKFDSARVKVGAEVPMRDSEGHTLVGKVLSISDKEVEMDFNHPLAGYDLHFRGEVLDVRDATQEELDHGHVHGPHGHHH